MRSQHRHRLRGAIAASALLVLGLSACSSPLTEDASSSEGDGKAKAEAQEVYDQYAAMDEPDRTEALIKAAKAEGELNLYGTDSLGDMGEAFNKEYGIKINFYEADTDTVVAKIAEEAKAGRYSADFFNGGSTLLLNLDKNGLLGDYESPLRDEVPADGKGDHWTGYRRQPFIAAYNTDEINAADIPDDYLDFADPKWKGKISLELGDYDWYMGLVMYYEAQGMSRADIDAKFHAIASNARIADGHSDQAQLLAAGQFGVSLSAFIHHTIGLQEDGAPIQWGGDDFTTVQPIIMRYEGVAIMSHAPHPAAATLFMDYLLGPIGSQMTKDEGQLPAAPDPAGDPLDGLNVVLLSTDEYVNNGAAWSKAYDELLRSAER